ncbi:unnamed protein product [Blepharisma stoltei]|uniref:Ubiquitin-like protease family profile domain-containing protein n=1 Tax=Blepharisma stoltei TaxID=1481888 RepID=A0AAU9JZP5_9CILI|nr:unnamed protein product [Blepharisma stoltei]
MSRVFISQNDENTIEILACKHKSIKIDEIFLEKDRITNNEPDLEIIEIRPSVKTQEENKFYEKNKEISLDSLKEVENIWNDERHEEIWENSTLLYKDIKCLQPGGFINDEIVNSYLKLLPLPKNVHIFNSFFYEFISEMLSSCNWNIKKLTRILRKQGISNIFSKKYLIFPINLNKSHWVAAQINNKEKCIEYYDSFGENSFERVCETINESVIRLGCEEIDYYEYKAMKVPRQSTCWDCGIFMMQTIRCLIENREFDFEQEKIDFIRKITVLELKNQTLYRLN